MGRSALVTASLWLGTPVVLRPRFSASGFWQDIRANGITWLGYFGAVILFLWRQPVRTDDADNPVRVAFGASAPPKLIEPWEQRFGLRLLETYGSTELGTVACPRVPEIKRPTMGRPVRHLQIAIHDEHDEPVAPGELGEIVARRPVQVRSSPGTGTGTRTRSRPGATCGSTAVISALWMPTAT